MSIKSIKDLDDHIREIARADFKAEVVRALAVVAGLIKNTTAVNGLKHDGKDIVDKKLLEVLQEHLLETQSFRREEEAIASVVKEVQEKGSVSFSFIRND